MKICSTDAMGAIGEYSLCVDKPKCLAYIDWSSHFLVGYIGPDRIARQLDISHKKISYSVDAPRCNCAQRVRGHVDSQLAGRHIGRRFQNNEPPIRNWERILDDLYRAFNLVIELTGCDRIVLGGSLTAKLEHGFAPVQNNIERRFHDWQYGKYRRVSLIASSYGESPLVGATLVAKAAMR